MLKVKEVGSKITPPKKNITISGVKISGDNLVDEDGPIIDRLIEALPDGEDTQFSIKISIELLDKDSDKESVDSDDE